MAAQARGLLPGERPLALDGFPRAAWFLLEARERQAPTTGHGLLVVLPGGTGSANFLPWVRDVLHAQAPGDFLCAMQAEPDRKERKEGKASLHVRKTGGLPLDLLRQDVTLPEVGRVTVRAWVKSQAAGNAFLKFFVFGASDEPLHRDVDLVQLHGDSAWRQVERTWELKGAARGTVQIVLVQSGEVWGDAVEVVAGT